MKNLQSLFYYKLPYNLWQSEQISCHEARIAAQFNLSTFELMQLAGKSSFKLLQQLWPKARQICLIAGAGNNGGDAYSMALLAYRAGMHVQLIQLGNLQKICGDAAIARNAWLAAKQVCLTIDQANLADVDVIVDGVLGTGFRGLLSSDYKSTILRINQSNAPVLALDLPSGLCAKTGYVAEIAVHATVTISFVGLKPGLFTGLAADYCGQIYFAGLGIDRLFSQQIPNNINRVDYKYYQQQLSPRKRTSHKGNFGHVAVIGGNMGMSGAVKIAGEAALRTGAGLVSLFSHPENSKFMNSYRPELMSYATDQHQPNWCQIQQASVLVIGPGLAQDSWAQYIFNELINYHQPKILDADALAFLAKNPHKNNNWILTPHPGEAARLLDCSVADIEVDRYAAAQQIQQKFAGVVVLKGAGTIICSKQAMHVANVGNPGMASGGMGDLLSGIIAGLVAQHFSLLAAAAIGVCVHGAAADLAAKQGERGMLATDLLPYIRQLVNP